MKKVALINHGCAKNLVDSELMLGLLAEKGYEITLDETDADVVVINTCSFIHDAEKESVQSILKPFNPIRRADVLSIAVWMIQRRKNKPTAAKLIKDS